MATLNFLKKVIKAKNQVEYMRLHINECYN